MTAASGRSPRRLATDRVLISHLGEGHFVLAPHASLSTRSQTAAGITLASAMSR
jgi:hypothetical protein